MPQSKIKNAGTGTVIISSPDATATYTASSVTVTPHSLSNVTYTAGTGISSPTWSSQPTGTTGTLHAKDVILDGVSLKTILEERLNILVPNPELEKEWAELKQLGDKYRQVEADLKEKARMWKALNKV